MIKPLTGQAAVDALVGLLDVEPLGEHRYQGLSPAVGPQRIFGGQVAAQALVAAGRSVDPARHVHSLHGYFVRGGDPSEPIEYEVENIRDGRSFSVRRSVARQHGKVIFFMSASFHRPEEGLDHQQAAPEVPGPEGLRSLFDVLSGHPNAPAIARMEARPLDIRYVGEPLWMVTGERTPEPNSRVWMRFDGRLPDDPLMHSAFLTFASDLALLDSVLSMHGAVWGPGGFAGASLDHALWFHRPIRVDEWFLYDCSSPSASGARGLANGRMFTREGRHIASAVQEGLLRRVGG